MISTIKRLLVLLLLLSVSEVSANDRCKPFDSWVGGERVESETVMPVYAVITKIYTESGGIWRYYDTETDTAYIKLFVDRWQVCVYRLRGSGMGLPEFDIDEIAS